MKKFLFVTGLLLASILSFAQTDEQKAVQQAIAGVFDGLSYRDIIYVKQNTTTGFTVLEQGVVWTMDTIVAKIDQLRAMTSYHRDNYFQFLQTSINGNTAFVSYFNNATIIVKGKSQYKHWLESAYLVKEGDNWKVQLLHSSVVPSQVLNQPDRK
ncbi:MAG: nuclear transport factor 2 family protein [Chitinophagaceae bacterium]|nr:MAG: nuclear transport factor 2 family protein [Chitinophagaceae bacterium]